MTSLAMGMTFLAVPTEGSEMLWCPQTLVFILHKHGAIRMRDPNSRRQKTEQLRQEGVSEE